MRPDARGSSALRRALAAMLVLAVLASATLAFGAKAYTAPARKPAPSSPAHPTPSAAPAAARAPAKPAAAPARRAAPTSTYPAGPGQAIAERACLFCHSPMLVTQQAKDSTGWEKTIGQMEQWGAPVNAAEHDTLRRYLLARYGPRPTPAAPAPGVPTK